MVVRRTILIGALLGARLAAPEFSAFALNPKRVIAQYGHDIWLRRNGLPTNAVNVCLQTRDGYLWVGTSAGLFRYDGDRFLEVTTDSSSNRSSETISSLFESAGGNLWIGTRNSWLCLLTKGNIRRVGEPEGILSRNINAVIETRDGKLWVGTSFGLYTERQGRFISVPLRPTYVSTLCEDSIGRIWVGTFEGVRVLGADSVTTEVNAALKNRVITTIYTDPDGAVWVGTYDGLLRWDRGATNTYSMNDGLSDSHITAILEDRDANLWVGTNRGGINRLTAGTWSSLTIADGLTNNHVLSVSEDYEGSIWVSTLDGLNRFKNVNLTTYDTHLGLASDYISSVVETPDSSLYFMSDVSSVITRLKGGRSTVYSLPVGPACVARDGSLWIAHNGSLTNLKDNRLRRYDTASGLPAKWISAITEDSIGLIVYFDALGIRRVDHGRVHPYLLPGGVADTSTEYVGCFYPDPSGTLWIGTSRGLVRVDAGGRRVFGIADGMADHYVSSIWGDRRGSIWLGSPHGGLTRYENGRFTAYTTANGLFTNEICCILSDDQGDIWLSSPRGIARVRRREADDFAAGKITSIHSEVFQTADGMKSENCYGAWQPAGWKAGNGALWFATNKGAVLIDPATFTFNSVPPGVQIEKVVAGGRDLSPAQAITLSPGTTTLEFDYTALSYLVPARVLFRYRLEGFDHDWVNAGTRRTAYYTGLTPGQYRFRVIACNNDGVWNETGADVPVNLAPHFYETWWFLVFCLAFGGIAVVTAHRLKVRQVLARTRDLESRVEERTGELLAQKNLLAAAEEQYRTLVQNQGEGIAIYDAEERFLFANPALHRIFGLSPGTLVGRSIHEFIDEESRGLLNAQATLRSSPDSSVYELDIVLPGEEKRTVLVTATPQFDGEGRFKSSFAIFHDITERKSVERRLATSALEKELLLKEIHHRVKNNLQVVSSLLGIQAHDSTDEKTRRLFRESQDRVRSMAVIHEQLYRSRDLARIHFSRYLEELSVQLIRSYSVKDIRIVVAPSDVTLKLDVAIPCGLIVNELVSNSIKHAFPGLPGGTIGVSIESVGGGVTRLCVEDDGVGFPLDHQLESVTSMGLTLVTSLSRQIGGTLSLERDHGTRFSLLFPGS